MLIVPFLQKIRSKNCENVLKPGKKPGRLWVLGEKLFASHFLQIDVIARGIENFVIVQKSICFTI